MSLRRRKYVLEATYGKDKLYRDIAEEFYQALFTFLSKRSDELVYRASDGGYSVHAKEFWKDPFADNLGVVFVPKKEGALGGIGRAGSTNVIVLNIMKGPGDKSHLSTRLDRGVVVHEMIHLLDPGRKKTKGSAGKFTPSNPSNYYNDPGEWNAYWQEGAASAERLLHSFSTLNMDASRKAAAKERFFGDGSLKQFMASIDRFWNKAFTEYMDKKTRRKFDKRLAQLWKEFKDKGLL